MRNISLYAITLAIVLTGAMAVLNQVRKGEPRLGHAALFGVLTAGGTATFLYWQRRRTNSDPDSLDS